MSVIYQSGISMVTRSNPEVQDEEKYLQDDRHDGSAAYLRHGGRM